jgi:transcriptional regulator of acetoin/glycerol metabolism
MTALLAHRWPGNVRELEHVVERALLLCQGDTVAREDLALIVGRSEGEGARFEQMTLDEAERQPMQRALAHSRGQVSDAAKTLGLSRSALYRRLQHHGLKVSE